MPPTADYTIAVAFGAGIASFVSPCVLPLVPAYLGQLTVVAVTGAGGAQPSRWLAVRHALAYVLGFAFVFTLLGVTATLTGGGLFTSLPVLRTLGGILLVVLGLNLAGVVRIPVLDRAWHPMEAGAAASLAAASGTVALAPPGAPGMGGRLGGRIVSGRGGWLASFGLGVVFAVGWTPCIGIILGGIIMMAATAGQGLQGGILLFAYSLGLGLPFLALAVVYDRAPALIRPLVRHGRAVSIIGGAVVALIGVAMIFDWLSYLARFAPGI